MRPPTESNSDFRDRDVGITAKLAQRSFHTIYDADGHRVKKIIGGVATRFVYNLAGQLIAEYDEGTSSLTKEYVYKGGALVATVEPTNVVKYATADHLGTPRVWTNSSGAVVTSGRHDYAPFGEELSAGYGVRTTGAAWPSSAQADGQRKQFGSKERDTETGLDYFGARYLASVQGRFTSVDPLLSSAEIAQPQSWNRYTYTFNNPLKYSDPLGLYVWSAALGGNVSDEELLRNAGDDRGTRRRAQGIIDQRTRFRNGLTAARNAAENSDNPQQVLNSVNAYGAEGQDNGVTVAFGATQNGAAAETTANGQNLTFNADGTVRANVLVTINNNTRGNELAVAVAHEGRHTLDRQAFARVVEDGLARGISQDVIASSPYNPTVRVTETRAYTTSSLVAQGLRMENFIMQGTNARIWDSGWSQADRATLRSNGINQHITNSPSYRDRLNVRVFPTQ